MFRAQLDELVPNPSRLELDEGSPLKAIEPAKPLTFAELENNEMSEVDAFLNPNYRPAPKLVPQQKHHAAAE